MPWSGNKSTTEGLIFSSALCAAVEGSVPVQKVAANINIQTPKSAMEEEWDYCQEGKETFDDDYILVQDFKFLDIKSQEISASGLSIGPQSLLGLMDLVLKSVGSTELTASNGKTTTLANILHKIDESVTGSRAMVYKQHAACSVLLQRYLTQLRETEIFLAGVAADTHLTGAGTPEFESKLQEKRGSLHEVRETLQRFAQQVNLKDQQIAKLRQEIENNRSDFVNRFNFKVKQLTELQGRIAELEEGQTAARDNEQTLCVEHVEKLDRIGSDNNSHVRKVEESNAICAKGLRNGSLPTRGIPSRRSRYT